ncbi:hypothetical protein WN943_021257 [Citrus x changshan-huyou]
MPVSDIRRYSLKLNCPFILYKESNRNHYPAAQVVISPPS